MPIDRRVAYKAARYTATVTSAETDAYTTVEEDSVAITRPDGRAILRVPIAEWGDFLVLIDDTSSALLEKQHVESSVLVLPWEQPPADALVAAAPGGEDDSLSAPPPTDVPGDRPLPPRVSA